MQELTDNYLIELFKICISHDNALEIINKHLKEHFLPSDSYKKLWFGIRQHFELLNHAPTIGVLTEKFKDDQDILNLIVKIKKCKLPEINTIFPTFETFIKEISFTSLHVETAKLWNNKETDKAIKMLAEESHKINDFSLTEGIHQKVFFNFNKRLEDRMSKEYEPTMKIPFGIHALDYDTFGGGLVGTSGLWLARSGTGKTIAQRWTAVNAARMGLRVVHFEIESTEEESLAAYDAAWGGIPYIDIEYGNISKTKILELKNVSRDIVNKHGEVFVVAPGGFDSMSIEFCNETIEELEKSHGKIHLALFDNLELFNVHNKFSNSEMGERLRRETIANKITNIAVQKKLFSLATTQANDIKPDKFNAPDFVMSRSDISEFKNLIKPFSYFMTWNVTYDEYNNNTGRIYNDKFRKYRSGQVRNICTSMETMRFYDAASTLRTFWDAKNNKPL